MRSHHNFNVPYLTLALVLSMGSAGAHAIEPLPAPKPMPAPKVIKQTPLPQKADRLQPGNAAKPDWKSARVDPSKASPSPFQRKSDIDSQNEADIESVD